MTNGNGSIISAFVWMTLLSVLLVWLPVFGSLIAGVVGGKKAGGILKAVIAVFLPALILGFGLFLSGSALSSLPVVGGVIASIGGVTLALLNVGPLLLGAVIGALLSD